MVSDIFPIQPVFKANGHADYTKWTELVKLGAGATFPALTLVSVNASNEVVNYDTVIHNMAISVEAANDAVANVRAGQHIFAPSKDRVLVDLIGDSHLIMTASYTGGTPVIYDPATHDGQQFEGAIDPVSGFVFIDLTTAGSGPFTIVRQVKAPGLPDPTNTSLSTEKRLNARVEVAVDPTTVFVGF